MSADASAAVTDVDATVTDASAAVADVDAAFTDMGVTVANAGVTVANAGAIVADVDVAVTDVGAAFACATATDGTGAWRPGRAEGLPAARGAGWPVGVALLVVAKAPVAGLAKTRLTPPATPAQAARIAAAALLDTLDAAHATGARVVVAMTGRLADAELAAELRTALGGTTVLAQRGATFADRLANVHADAGAALQVGMDTPQLTADLLADAAARLSTVDAVLGPASDGGWWALGLREPAAAEALRTVPMSRADTGERTLHALRRLGLRVGLLPELSDVDTMADARQVARRCAGSRFAAAVHAVTAVGPAFTVGAAR